MLTQIKKTVPAFKKPSLWNKIQMYFGWGEYAFLPDLDLAETDDNPESIFYTKHSQPYIINIENTGKTEQQAVIFGCHKYLIEDNFGNHKSIDLSTSLLNVQYHEIVSQLSCCPEEFSLIRLQSINTQQILEPLKLTAADANGNKIEKVVVPQLDPYQMISTIVQINKTFVIDGNLNIKVKILPKTKLQIYLYPASRGKQISSFDSLANLIGYERKKYSLAMVA